MVAELSADPVIIGRFGKAFGILGWIKIISFTSPHEHILKLKPWLVQTKKQWEEVEITASKKHAASIIVKLSIYNTPEEAHCLTNAKIGIWRHHLPPLAPNEYYWADLLGLQVINQAGVNLGGVQDLLATGANDVLIVRGTHKYLIPYISTVITTVDLVNKTIYVEWPEDFL